ncbi:uncharacterized protein B0H64DRAFT_403238 [Chaetomium fimeti]|uniref:Uncharacterized protein n=1 Tax=Chaetomium fimeti TaxID=1854472 RepID=A0AAE0HAW3_9PEZI|nr:hypothetical protein B0H64DRAFT_403238 [Chaetomium fimeti]
MRRWLPLVGGCKGCGVFIWSFLSGCVQLGVGLSMGMDTIRSSAEDGFLEGFICSFLTTYSVFFCLRE